MPGDEWYAIWTRSNCEQLVHDELRAKGFDVFLPKVGVWSRRAGRRQLAPAPMFRGYLFLRRAMDKESYIAVSRASAALCGKVKVRLPVPQPTSITFSPSAMPA